MLHNNGTVVAISNKPNDSVFQKSFMLTDFYFGAPDSPYPFGAIQLMGKTDPDTLIDEVRALMPEGDIDPEYVGRHSIDFFLTAEDLPRHDNQVRVRPDGGIQLAYYPNNLEAYQRLRRQLIDVLEAAGYRYGYCKPTAYVGFKLGISGVSHQLGTCRFGVDPRASVLDLNCKAHDLDNLYVVDTSFFPSAGAVNPSLTAMANALRVGDHLLSRLSS
jgi:choline dehydrogenase-like flavoprotein